MAPGVIPGSGDRGGWERGSLSLACSDCWGQVAPSMTFPWDTRRTPFIDREAGVLTVKWLPAPGSLGG